MLKTRLYNLALDAISLLVVELVVFSLIAVAAGLLDFAFIIEAAQEIAPASTPAPVPTPAIEQSWYQNPALMAFLGGISVVVIGKLIDIWAKKQEEKRNAQKDDSTKQQTFTEKVQELQFQDRQKFIADIQDFHEQKMADKNEKIVELKISEYYARERVHAFGNYVNSLEAYKKILEIELTACKRKPPFEFKSKSYDEIMIGVEDKVLAFQAQLRIEEEERRKEKELREKKQ